MLGPVVAGFVLPLLDNGLGVVLQPGQGALLLHSVHEPGPFDLNVLQLVFVPPISDLGSLSQAPNKRFDGGPLTDAGHQAAQHAAVVCSGNVKCGIKLKFFVF